MYRSLCVHFALAFRERQLVKYNYADLLFSPQRIAFEFGYLSIFYEYYSMHLLPGDTNALSICLPHAIDHYAMAMLRPTHRLILTMRCEFATICHHCVIDIVSIFYGYAMRTRSPMRMLGHAISIAYEIVINWQSHRLGLVGIRRVPLLWKR